MNEQNPQNIILHNEHGCDLCGRIIRAGSEVVRALAPGGGYLYEHVRCGVTTLSYSTS